MNDITPEAEQPKPKQFLLMVNELNMAFLLKVMPNLQFVEIEGMQMKDNITHQLLVNPLNIPKVETVSIEAAEAPEVA